jgi:hypothetical protein
MTKVLYLLTSGPDLFLLYTEEEWEAELEGELNEFEVVSSKEGSPQNAEWENEIQNMLDAEESGK